MPELIIFGGTTEGREAALRFPGALVCVASEYARSLLPPGTPCHAGALDRPAMEAFLREQQPRRVLDATHPYALRATQNILACCRSLGIPYERIARPPTPGAWRQYVHAVPDTPSAVAALQKTEGNILLTTGSHTLLSYARGLDARRLFVRVLPTQEALTLCREAGLPAAHVMAMQGPFSTSLNAALYAQWDIRVMVTKDSGKNGGVEEKVLPALEKEIEVVLIERPKEDTCAEKA